MYKIETPVERIKFPVIDHDAYKEYFRQRPDLPGFGWKLVKRKWWQLWKPKYYTIPYRSEGRKKRSAMHSAMVRKLPRLNEHYDRIAQVVYDAICNELKDRK